MRKLQIFSLLTLATIAGAKAQACDVLETRMMQTSVFVSEDARRWEADDGLNVVECKGGYLQIALGAALPHPQSYSGLMFTGADYQRAPLCSSVSDSQTKSIDFSNTVRSHQELARECMGVTVEDPSGSALQLLASQTCDVVSKNKSGSALTLKGDNCLIKPSKAGLSVRPAVLNSCGDQLTRTKLRELDLMLNIQFANTLDAKTAPDGLAAKPVHVVFGSGVLPNQFALSAKTKDSKNSLSVRVSSVYDAKLALAKFELRGSTETGLLADASYFIDHSEPSASTQYRIPLIVKNELYLVQNGSSSLHLGSWYNGSIVSPGWTGQDGAATFNRLFDTQAPGKLSKLANAIRAGDKLVLVSKFENPNAAPGKYASFIRQLRAKARANAPKPLPSQSNKTVSELPKLDSLSAIEELAELPSLAGLSDRQAERMRDLMTWPIRYSKICMNSHCAKPEEIGEALEIQTIFSVESSEFEVTLKKEKQLEKWNGQVESNPEQNLNQTIECI